MGNMTDNASRAREERALGVFKSLTRGMDPLVIERIKTNTVTDHDRGFSTVRQAIAAWDDVLIASDGVIEDPDKLIHMPL